MRAPLHNFANPRLTRAATLLLPVGLIPLVLVGVTGLPAGAGRLAQARLEEARDALEIHQEQLSELAAFGPYDEVRTLEALTIGLAGLVPEERTDIELYSTARIAARQTGLELTSIQIQGTTELGTSLAGRPLSTRDTRVQGTGSLDELVSFVDHMRALGVPCVVHRFTVSRAALGEPAFQFELHLGAFQYAPESSGSE